MRTLKKGNNNAKQLAYTSLVRPILEYGVGCWDPYRKCQVKVLDRIQNNALKFAGEGRGENCNWESLENRKKLARLCAMFKTYTGKKAWKCVKKQTTKAQLCW